MHNDPPEQAIAAMAVLTALAVFMVYLADKLANWLR